MYQCFCLIFLILATNTSVSRSDETTVLTQLQATRESCQTAETWKQRRELLRREFLKGAGLHPLPERPVPVAIRHSLRQYDGYTVENVAIKTVPGFYCTGNLYRPVGRKELQPAILCPHGHFRPRGRFRDNHQIRCAHLARMGATVFSYSMVGWQDSQQTTHDDPRVLALQTWNSLRVVDFLSSLERVDPQRIGITGASGGGTQSIFLTLVDDRITASAPLVIVYPWAAPDGCLCEGGLPVMQEAQTNAIELAAAASPRPQLLISVGADATKDFPSVGFKFIQQMYGLAGAKHTVRNVHLADEQHDFGPSKRKEVYAFFARHLNLKPGPFYAGALDLPAVPAEDLDHITLEHPEQMQVFNDENPLPATALQGSDIIGLALKRYLDKLRAEQESTTDIVRVRDAPVASYSFRDAGPADEALMFTAAGFEQTGEPRTAPAGQSPTLHITVRDSVTLQPTPCRINVVGPDGHYYEPRDHELKPFSLTGVWPKSGWGNRQAKAPVRYFGHFFYSNGEATVRVPAGTVRVEVWKGFEYRPATATVQLNIGQKQNVVLDLDHTIRARENGYWSGDPHIHIHRRDATDEARILDLMQAEDIHYATVLAYNEPAGPYAGFMRRMEAPQTTGFGKDSIINRDGYSILSGQEYRSRWYGHINFFLIDQLVFNGSSFNANDWPPFGLVAQRVRDEGGVAFYAHGGYAQEIYADVVQNRVDGVELLQFGVYRGIGLNDWYHMLNTGFRVPANGACDYPACRKLGDCRTYVWSDQEPGMEGWLRGMAAGKSFVTSGPVLLLDVDGVRPGGQIDRPAGTHHVTASVRVRSDVAPITHVQLIANGRILREIRVPGSAGTGNWIQLEQSIELEESAWIAARAFSLSPTGTPDAESHTNPVYVIVDDCAPYSQDSLDVLVKAIDGQIAIHKKREFEDRARVIAYFERSRDILMKLRERGGAPAGGHPSDVVHSEPSIDPAALRHTDEELREYLKPVPPRSVAEAAESFETIPGIEMQLVASEPRVVDPIAAAFDALGHLYVCEMRDYPYKPSDGQKPRGTVRVLRDTDNNGTLDTSSVFADGLLWAAGVACWKGGVFVAAAPNIWYLKDTDGDFVADVREKIYTGFGTGNQQAMLNNLVWGIDHKIYGSTAHNGGVISTVGGPNAGAKPVSVNGRDFRFDPVTGKFEAITGTVQFGTTFDDWGNRFLCSESRPLLHAVLPERYLARNPWLPVSTAIRNLTDGPVAVQRISPLERWRIIRSSRRVAAGGRSPNAAGASHHVIDAAAGVTVYRSKTLDRCNGDIFIGGAQNNLIHRRRLTQNGVSFSSTRVEKDTEFIRSSDNWFRPVNFVNAPDGTLYVLDMYREVLESIHVPDDVVKYLDLTNGRKHGRIWRIAPAEFESTPRTWPATVETKQLVEMLHSAHSWDRDTAHRLLWERQDTTSATPLRQLLGESSQPQARLHALWSLQGLQQLTAEDLMSALHDDHPAIRQQAIRLAEGRLRSNPALLQRVIDLAESPAARVRLQAAFSLGETDSVDAASALVDLVNASDDDPDLRTAVLSSVGTRPVEILSQLVGRSQTNDAVSQLVRIVGSRAKAREVERVLMIIAGLSDESRQSELLRQLGLALREQGRVLDWKSESDHAADRLLQSHATSAGKTATRPEADLAERQHAIQLLSCTPLAFAQHTLRSLLSPETASELQLAAVEALSAYRDPQIARWLLKGWDAWGPDLRLKVGETLLSRDEWTKVFLQSVVNGDCSAAQVNALQRHRLTSHRDKEISSLAVRAFPDATSDNRSVVLTRYQSAVEGNGKIENGFSIFQRECTSCHRVAGKGHAVGPNLEASASREPAALLSHILDPNRYVLPRYESWVVVDTTGRVHTGLILSQSSGSVTLQQGKGRSITLLRSNIEEIQGSGLSLMPEGFENTITPDEMGDLISWLVDVKQPGDAETLAVGTLPGLTEP